jgi:branched-chain amino acid transport system substrate-binding protein
MGRPNKKHPRKRIDSEDSMKAKGRTYRATLKSGVSRRTFIAASAGAIAMPAVLRYSRAFAAEPAIKVGLVTPRTGPLAGFAEADDYILGELKPLFDGGVENNGKKVRIEIVAKDGQSTSTRAAEVATQLIKEDEVDLLLGQATPDTTNPVADQAEANEVPCITTNCPWQPYFFGRNGDPAVGFDWTYHFFWGLEDVIAAFLALWEGTDTNKQVGGLFPNDADGNAWGDPERGLPPAFKAAGYSLLDPGRYQVLNDNFTSQIQAFKSANCEIVTGNMIPPDFVTFWGQAAQLGFRPKIVTIGKALLFPQVPESMGDRADGLSTEIWWTPNHPYKSSITGQSARELTDGYVNATKRPWTQPIGYQHALFEVMVDVIKRTEDIDDNKAILDAIAKTDLNTIVGPIKWTGQPVKNVSKTPLVAGQWQKTASGAFDLVICENKTAPEIPVGGALKLLS